MNVSSGSFSCLSLLPGPSGVVLLERSLRLVCSGINSPPESLCSGSRGCGNASGGVPGLWDRRWFSASTPGCTNKVSAELSCWGQKAAYGRGQEESGGSSSDVGKVESPGDPDGATTRKRPSDLPGFILVLGNKPALTHSHTHRSSHTFC